VSAINRDLNWRISLIVCSGCNCEEWEEFAERMKLIADNAITASRHFRFKVDSLIRQGQQDIKYQNGITDQAFQTRLQQIYSIKEDLQIQLSQVQIHNS